MPLACLYSLALQLMEYMFVLVSSTMELKVIVFGGDNIVKNTQNKLCSNVLTYEYTSLGLGQEAHPSSFSTRLFLWQKEMQEKLTREGGATRAPISIDLARDGTLSIKSIILQNNSKNQQVSASALQHSLQDRICKSSGKIHDEIYYLKLRTSTVPPLKLIDLPRVDKGFDDSLYLLSVK